MNQQQQQFIANLKGLHEVSLRVSPESAGTITTFYQGVLEHYARAEGLHRNLVLAAGGFRVAL